MIDSRLTYRLSEVFSLLSVDSRLRILLALTERDMNVTELVSAIGFNQSTTSVQLKVLRMAGLVKAIRVGKNVRYGLTHSPENELLLSALSLIGVQND